MALDTRATEISDDRVTEAGDSRLLEGHDVGKITRLSIDGYMARRAGSFAGRGGGATVFVPLIGEGALGGMRLAGNGGLAG